MLEPGERVEGYEVVGHLGDGGMASVWLAKNVELGSMHALKLLTATTATVRERLIAEGRAMARVQHPNVVHAFDLLLYQTMPMLVLEYVDGGTLAEYVRQKGAVPVEEAVDLGLGIAQGLVAAHELGVVHRDLKPDNVLLAEEGSRRTPKISDFGLIKGLSSLGLTQTGASMGTPGYMAPEQIRDAAAVDSRADLFSLGVLLYYMLAGKPPFAGKSAIDVLMASCRGEYPRLSAHTPGIPTELEGLIDQLLAVDPADRPQSAAEVSQRLVALDLMTGRVGMHPVTAFALASSTSRPAPRRRKVVAAPSMSSTALLAVPMVVALSTPFLVRGEDAVAAAPLDISVEAGPEPVRAPVPAAEPAPAPVAPEPVPEPAPKVDRPAPRTQPQPAPPPVEEIAAPEPVPVAPVQTFATVRAEGEVSVVWLSREGERIRLPAAIPPGQWTVVALFSDTEPVTAGEVQVGSEDLTLQCNAFAMLCR